MASTMLQYKSCSTMLQIGTPMSYGLLYIFIADIHNSTVIAYSKGRDQPGKVASPARGQLNREN